MILHLFLLFLLHILWWRWKILGWGVLASLANRRAPFVEYEWDWDENERCSSQYCRCDAWIQRLVHLTAEELQGQSRKVN